MKILIHIVRLIVAVTFVFSGFVKLVDPLGSAYKFQEYFGSNVLNLEFLIPYALPFSIVLILAELMLGVFLLVGFKKKFTVWSLLVMMALFLFLTWYSAYYNKVTDCGCFGDAVTLSPWDTFYKNVILISLVLILLWKSKHICVLRSDSFAKWTSFLSFFMSLFIVYHVLTHLPIIDFRPYAVGNNISDGMQYVGDKDPLIHDFYLESTDGIDMTETILELDKVMLIISYNLENGDDNGFASLGSLIASAEDSGYSSYMLSASMYEEYEVIQELYKFQVPMLFCDETALKTVIRANPGIVTLQNGTVTGKWSWTDISKVKF